MNGSESECPICRRDDVVITRIESAVPFKAGAGFENRSHSDSAILCRCPACGEYIVTEMDCTNLKSPRSKWNPRHLSALVREQTIRSSPAFWLQDGMDPYGPLKWHDPKAPIPIDVHELLQRWPRAVPERIDRTLSNLGSLSPTGGHRVDMQDSDLSLAFAETVGEAIYNRRALIEQGCLEHLAYEPGSAGLTVWLTPKGWSRFDELTRGKSAPKNPVFVAMSFGGTDERQKMDEVFQQGIQPAIEQAGYRATRADLVEHNDWIMDKILADIRLAPFVVADFTEHRNGVYLEAGFARGLGMPVIHTCRVDHLDNAHFDTRQLNHVVWETAGDLRNKLYQRIVATIGQGPHPPRAEFKTA